MRRLRIGSGPDSATMSKSWPTRPDERLYLQRQMRIARAGIGHVLTGVPRGLPRVIDPRRWIRYHPIACTSVLFGTIVAVRGGVSLTPLSAAFNWLGGPFRRLTGLVRVGTGVVRSIGRALIGMRVARGLWDCGL